VNPTCYAIPGELTSPKWCDAFSAGCRGAVTAERVLRPGPVALFGSPHLWPLLTQARAEGRDWYYGDHSYLGGDRKNGRGTYFRCTRNAFQHDGGGEALPRRFEALGLRIWPWRTGGKHVLICPNTPEYFRLMGLDGEAWLADVTARLQAHTDRPLRVRSKKQQWARPLSQDLYDCWAVVVFTSNCAVQALLKGIPVFAMHPCAAFRMGTPELERIEAPPQPVVRDQFFFNLAAQQWTLDEMRQGAAWRALNGQEASNAA
jgi:hypothetical protein